MELVSTLQCLILLHVLCFLDLTIGEDSKIPKELVGKISYNKYCKIERKISYSIMLRTALQDLGLVKIFI